MVPVAALLAVLLTTAGVSALSIPMITTPHIISNVLGTVCTTR